jgi:hypothetical protein
VDDLPGALTQDPTLAGVAAAARAEWRDDEEWWIEAAARAWHGRRDLVDVARDLAARGDQVVICATGSTFTGALTAVGDGVLVLDTRDGVVDVAIAALVSLRVASHASSGGCRPERASWRARLLEWEAGDEVEVGTALDPAGLRGRLRAGRDHVALRGDDGSETFVPLSGISWVRAAR